MENQMQIIRFNVNFKGNTLTAELSGNQKLKKVIPFACNQLQCPNESFKFYFKDRELNENDTPISVNLENNDTILMIKHIRTDDDDESMETDIKKSASGDTDTTDEMEIEEHNVESRNTSTHQSSTETIDVTAPHDFERNSTKTKLLSTLDSLLMDIRREDHQSNKCVQTLQTDVDVNSTKSKLFATLDKLIMDVKDKDVCTNDTIHFKKPIIPTGKRQQKINQSEQTSTQHEAERCQLNAKINGMQLEHAAQIKAMKSNYNESLVVANQKIEQLNGEIDDLKSRHAIDISKHVENAYRNAKIMHEKMQNEKVQDFKKLCQELKIELQNKEKKGNEDLMSAIDSAKSQSARITFDYERQIQEMNEAHKQSEKKLLDKITELKNLYENDIQNKNKILNQQVENLQRRNQEIQSELEKTESKCNRLVSELQLANSQNVRMTFTHKEQLKGMTKSCILIINKLNDKISKFNSPNSGEIMQRNSMPINAQSKPTNCAELIALNEQIDQLEKCITGTKDKYEFDIVQLKTTLEKEQKCHQTDSVEWEKTKSELVAQVDDLDAKLKKQELIYEKDYETYVQMLSKKDRHIKEQDETITSLRANITQLDEQRAHKDVQYTQKVLEIQQAYIQQLEKIASDMNSGRFTYDDNTPEINLGVLKTPKVEAELIDKKPMALIATPIDDANGLERKCFNCSLRAIKKCTMAFCNSTCMKVYFKKKSEQYTPDWN